MSTRLAYSELSLKGRIIRRLSSLKLAVVILSVICVLIGTGTIVEAQFDAAIASKLVYKTWWMYIALGALVLSLTAVMIDRWPWQKKHVPFIFAHVGIVILLLGSFLTAQFGLDGTMRVAINDSGRFITLPKTEFVVYASFDAKNYVKLFQKTVDFYLNPPEKHPIVVSTDDVDLKVSRYLPFALQEKKVKVVEGAGPAVRFQLSNDKVNLSDWVFMGASQSRQERNLGPAKIVLLQGQNIPLSGSGGNEIFLQAKPGSSILNYTVFSANSSKKNLRGTIQEGGRLLTNWMGLELRVLRFLPHAEEVFEYKEVSKPSELSTEAIEISFLGKTQWLSVDDVVKFFTSKAVYVVAFTHQKYDLGFDLRLKSFEIGRHLGSMKASSYKSHVEILDEGVSKEHVIAMNEPLKFRGLTFYQASFQQDPTSGVPVASIFSVNADPGRWLKYLGSLLVVVGSVWLFYRKRQKARVQAPESGEKGI